MPAKNISNQTWLGDAWDGSLSFLTDGLNVYKDYLTVTGEGPGMIPAGMSYDQYAEKFYPDDTQAQQPTAQPQPSGQWIAGVDNVILLLAGAAVALLVIK